MNGYETFLVYHPIKLHFTTSYDVLKYNGKTKRLTYEVFQQRKDKQVFESWANVLISKDKVGKVCIANFVYGDAHWLHKDKNSALECFTRWSKIRSTISLTLEKDLNELRTFIDGDAPKISSWEQFISKTSKRNKPPLLQLLLSNSITIESVCLLDRIGDSFIDEWYKLYADDPMINTYVFMLIKYRPFCNRLINPNKMFTEIIKQ